MCSLEFPSLSQVVQDILEHEREFVKELQTVLGCYLRPLQASDKYDIKRGRRDFLSHVEQSHTVLHS